MEAPRGGAGLGGAPSIWTKVASMQAEYVSFSSALPHMRRGARACRIRRDTVSWSYITLQPLRAATAIIQPVRFLQRSLAAAAAAGCSSSSSPRHLHSKARE